MSIKTLSALGFLALTLGLAGCGSDEPDLYHVSGTATFDGKPIPQGKIYFEPDSNKGNKGPAGFAAIKDGKFDTQEEGGKGHVSGPMIVRIDGQDPAASATKDPKDTSGEEIVKTLFPTYTTEAELPKEDSTKEFAVPADAAKKKIQSEDSPRPSGGV
jgi:hypothetical protein